MFVANRPIIRVREVREMIEIDWKAKEEWAWMNDYGGPR